MKNSPLLELPFDQYSRQSKAREIIDALRNVGETFTILDVGGHKGATRLFHPNDHVDILDVYDIHEENYIRGDATKMSLKDKSYDFVVSFDVLEHIPRNRRNKFVEECIRVAKRGLIIAHPINTEENAKAELYLNDLYKKLHNHDHKWLKEHIDNGLPEPHLVTTVFRKHSLHHVEIPSNFISLWIFMQSIIFTASKVLEVGLTVPLLFKKYNSLFTNDGVLPIESNYRVIAIGLMSGADLKKIRKVVSIDSAFLYKNDEVLKLGMESLTLSVCSKIDLQATEVNKAQAELASARNDLDAIINSKSYKLARTLASIKNSLFNYRNKSVRKL